MSEVIEKYNELKIVKTQSSRRTIKSLVYTLQRVLGQSYQVQRKGKLIEVNDLERSIYVSIDPNEEEPYFRNRKFTKPNMHMSYNSRIITDASKVREFFKKRYAMENTASQPGFSAEDPNSIISIAPNICYRLPYQQNIQISILTNNYRIISRILGQLESFMLYIKPIKH